MTSLEQITARLDELEKRVAIAERERDKYRALYIETLERCRKLERGLLASKSEHLSDNGAQLSLDVLSMVLDDRQRAQLEAALEAANAEQEVKGHTRSKPTGRKPLAEHLPRVEIVVLPAEVEKLGLDALERIGEDVSKTIERRPASIVVARVVRPKFVAKDRERNAETEVLIAEPLELPIPAASQARACWPIPSFGAGKITCPSIGLRTCTHATAWSSPAQPCGIAPLLWTGTVNSEEKQSCPRHRRGRRRKARRRGEGLAVGTRRSFDEKR